MSKPLSSDLVNLEAETDVLLSMPPSAKASHQRPPQGVKLEEDTPLVDPNDETLPISCYSRIKPFFLPAGIVALVLISLGIVLVMVTISSPTPAPKRQITIKEFVAGVFSGKTISGIQWLPDSSAFTFIRRNPTTGRLVIMRNQLSTGAESVLLDTSNLTWNNQPLVISAYSTTGRQERLLLTGPVTPIWRRSFTAPYFIYNLESATLIPLAGGSIKLQFVQLSPDNEFVAFVQDNNLFVAPTNATTPPKQITFDGSSEILNGVFDWVYEEEFGRGDALRWSPDSRRIAFWRTNQTEVNAFPLFDETHAQPTITTYKYPLAGQSNSLIAIGIYELSTGQMTWADLGPDTDIYVPRIDWTADPLRLGIQRLNRRQTHLTILSCNALNGATTVLAEDKYENYWVMITDDVTFLKNTPQFVWTTEQPGFRHIFVGETNGTNQRQITSGLWEVTSIVGIDEQNGFIYFYGKKDGTINQCLYRTDFTGVITRISPPTGWMTASFSPDFTAYIGTYSTATHQPTVALYDVNGVERAMLEANPLPILEEVAISYPSFLQFEGAGQTFDAYLIKPAAFDPSKTYPVLVYGYSGPESQLVSNNWAANNFWFHTMLANSPSPALIFVMDHRGSKGRGRAFAAWAYGDISRYAVADQLEGVAYLRSLPYVDPSRIGFWGWSGGGFLSSHLMTRTTAYAAGAAVAPLTAPLNYDTIWTERFMDLPSRNPAGYNASNPLPYASGLSGQFLIIHGTGDDNVHPENTIMFVNALIRAGKQFEMMLYPSRNHGISDPDARLHLFTLLARFFAQHLAISSH